MRTESVRPVAGVRFKARNVPSTCHWSQTVTIARASVRSRDRPIGPVKCAEVVFPIFYRFGLDYKSSKRLPEVVGILQREIFL